MFLSEAGSLFTCFILSISVVEIKPSSICALKGSSVSLNCSVPRSDTNIKWFSVSLNGTKFNYSELPEEGNDGKYRISEDGFHTLTIRNLTESDGKKYICLNTSVEQTISIIEDIIHLQFADVQVKVFPATEGQKVSLICSTSCSLTESPAAFIWYQNRELLYEDWSPWYRELVSSEDPVRYSCAVKGYEELRAPEISVDSVTPTCYRVTYAEGKMCSNSQTSVNQSCSVTFPRDLHVEQTEADDHVVLTCKTSCSLPDPLKSFRWIKNRITEPMRNKQVKVLSSSTDSFYCSVKDFEDLLSAQVCVDRNNCWSMNYVRRRICAAEGSSVNISSKYSHPEHQQPKSKLWYRINTNRRDEQLTEHEDRVKFHDDMKNQHTVRLINLQMEDTAEYRFTMKTDNDQLMQSDFTGVTLIVTGVRVDIVPAAEVTEGQRVTLTCRTSCPLTENTEYIWYWNSRPLDQRTTQNKKQLILDAVSSQDAGNYSCSAGTDQRIISAQETLTVLSGGGTWKPATAVVAALFVVLPLIVFLLRKYKTSRQISGHETVNNLEQVNSGPLQDEFPGQPEEQEPHYSQLMRNNTNLVFSSIQDQEQEEIHYAEVIFRTTPE